MRTPFAAALNCLHQIALSAWLGGILTIGAVTAPAVFGSAKAQGQRDLSQPLYAFAAEAMGVAFQRFNVVTLIAGALLLLAGLGYGMMANWDRKQVMIRAGLTVAALGIAAWLTFSLYPQLLEARAAGRMEVFDGMHKTYTRATQIELLLLLGVAAVTAWMHTAGRVAGAEKRAGESTTGKGAVAAGRA